jgi:hypothetical protein
MRLRTTRGAPISSLIMRAFVRTRRLLRPTAALARKIGEMERKYDAQFGMVFEAICTSSAVSSIRKSFGNRFSSDQAADHYLRRNFWTRLPLPTSAV